MKLTKLAAFVDRLKDANANPAVDQKLRRKDLSCSLCPPNRGENAKRKGKHGTTKPRYKNKR